MKEKIKSGKVGIVGLGYVGLPLAEAFSSHLKTIAFDGTVEFSSEIAKSLNSTAEHTENAKAPESLNNDWNSLKTLRTLRSPR